MSVSPSFFPPKRIAEVERRAIDWTAALPEGDAVASSAWSVEPSGLTLASSRISEAVTSILVSSGVVGITYNITNTITTAQGFTLVEVVTLTVI